MRRLGLASLLGIVLAAGLMHPLWRAEWAVMDDYQTLARLGESGSLPWSEVPAVIAMSETGHPGESGRYRPALWALHTLEAAWLGPSPARFFLWRTVQFGFILAVVWWIASAYVGALIATLLTVYTTTYSYWSDSFVHLFVSENWGAVFLAGFAIGAERAWRGWRRGAGVPTSALVTMAVAGTLAGACKENLLILLPLHASMLYLATRRSRPHPAVWLSSAVYALSGVAIAFAVLIGLRRSGDIDLYGNATDFTERLALLARPAPLAIVCASVVLIGLWSWAHRAGAARLTAARFQEWRALWKTVLVVFGVSTAVLLSQFVFYNGDWPTRGSRFDFPGRLIEMVAYALVWYFGRRSAAIWRVPPHWQRPAVALYALALVLLIARHPIPLLEAAREQVGLTQRIGAARRAVGDSVRGAPDRPVVLLPAREIDFEAVYAMAVQLRVVERLPNPLLVDSARVALSGPIVGEKAPLIAALSRDGGAGLPGRLEPPIRPWREFSWRRRAHPAGPVCLRLNGYDAPAPAPCPARLQ